MASSVVSRRLCSSAAAAAAPAGRTSRWERIKKSRVGTWCSGVLLDYREAVREVGLGMWARPLKASAYLGLLGGAGAAAYTRPDETSFGTHLLDVSNRLGLLSPWVRSPASDQHVLTLLQLRNEGRLRHVSLGLAALTLRADYDPETDLYEAQCGPLAAPWRSLHERVLDVGFAGRWWVLDAKMKDYDVNDGEFKSLPEHMQATRPPTVTEVETTERLHRESWLPVQMDEDKEEKI